MTIYNVVRRAMGEEMSIQATYVTMSQAVSCVMMIGDTLRADGWIESPKSTAAKKYLVSADGENALMVSVEISAV
jgi:hypothetical protein